MFNIFGLPVFLWILLCIAIGFIAFIGRLLFIYLRMKFDKFMEDLWTLKT